MELDATIPQYLRCPRSQPTSTPLDQVPPVTVYVARFPESTTYMVVADNDVPEGSAHMRQSVSGPILEHFHWGSAHDRLPAAQIDPQDGESPQTGSNGEEADSTKQRIKIKGQKNLCVIRSGQDWSGTTPEERKLYLETMHPVLERGMYFLRDEGHEVSCIENRMMTVIDPNTMRTNTHETFSLGFFYSLGSLEEWSKEHKTHLAIFGRFHQYMREVDNDYTLRLHHEISVMQPEHQDFEYIGCHPQASLLSLGSGSWETVAESSGRKLIGLILL
ncbi:phenylacetaldoxime dehydratase [Paraphaeosphaeria sporulosa]